MKIDPANKDPVEQDMLITVAVVTYNHGGSLNACIDSIARQTYKQIDLVVVDDYSCDFDQDAVESRLHGQEAGAIKCASVEGLKAHKGTVGAYKRALELAKGEYILFIGGDDCLAQEDVLEKIAKRLQKKPADVLQAKAKILQKNGEIIIPSEQCLEQAAQDKPLDLFRTTTRQPHFQLLCMQAAFFRTEYLRSFDAFPDDYRFAADWTVYAQLLFRKAVFASYELTATEMLDTGAYRTFSVGNVYIKKGYLREAAKAIRQFAVSDRIKDISPEEVLQFEHAANAFEAASARVYDWYYYSVSDKLAWRREHKNFGKVYRAVNPSFGASKLPIKWLFFTMVAVFLMWAAGTKLPENLVIIPSYIPFTVAAVVFFADLLRTHKKQGPVRIDYRKTAGFLFVILLCAIVMKTVETVCVTEILVLLMLGMAILGVTDIVARIIKKLALRKTRQMVRKG